MSRTTGPYTVLITGSNGYEVTSIKMDGFDELTPQENVVWMLVNSIDEAMRLLPEKKRKEIERAMLLALADMEEST